MAEGRSIDKLLYWLRRAALVVAVLLLAALFFSYRALQDRDAVADLGWPDAASAEEDGGAVTVTWLGVTTLLFDDGETQILIDGFFTRVGWLELGLSRIETDIATVNYAISEYRINRLAAIIPVHSHFDHAMDVGVVANRSTAVVLGSESTANIARGANLPVEQYQILADGEARFFGEFTITLLVSDHAPLAGKGTPYFPGDILEPLQQPAHFSAWKEGESYSILIAHPRGTTLVQGSAGLVPGKLQGIAADVVMLGIGGLHKLGRDYAGQYWRETVIATGAARVFPIHYDDFTRPFGEISLFPRRIDDALGAARWIDDFSVSTAIHVDVSRLPFGEPIRLY